jgi:nucleoside-diphosphate-sugar epimerase
MSDITDAQIDAEVRFVRTVAERLNGARLIYTSSCAVYGNGGDSTFYENATINPQCRYGAVKAACEGAVWEYGNHCIIRCGAVCGPSPRFRSDLAINAMVTDACKGRDIRVIGAQDWRPHINIYDACMSYIRVIESKYDSLKVLNRVAWNSRMIDVANEIARVTNARICVESDTTGRSYRVGTNWPDPYGDMQIHTSILDLTRWYGSGGFLEWMK